MNSLDKIIKKERRYRYKRLKKLIVARDMASKYIKYVIKVSDLDAYFREYAHNHYSTGVLAKIIVDDYHIILRLNIRSPNMVSTKK